MQTNIINIITVVRRVPANFARTTRERWKFRLRESLSYPRHNRALGPELVAILDSAIGVRIIA